MAAMVRAALAQVLNRLARTQLTAPACVFGGGDAGMAVSRTKATDCACVSDILPLLQLNRVVVDVHDRRNCQRDGQIEQHQQKLSLIHISEPTRRTPIS